MGALALFSAFSVAAISGCGSSGTPRPAAGPQPAQFSAAGRTAEGRSASVGYDRLTGFGATMSAWNAHHRTGSAYSNVTPQGGRVVEYTIKTGTMSIDTAIKRVKQELPADSREVWSAQKGNCYQVELTSRTVGRALSSAASGGSGDSGGGILAMMNTLFPNGSSAYRPGAVNEIMLSPGSYPSPADAPDC